MPRKQHSKFLSVWLNRNLHPNFCDVFKPVASNDSLAFCRLCYKNVNLATMGAQALTSHLQAKQHLQAMSGLRNQPSVSAMLKDGQNKYGFSIQL